MFSASRSEIKLSLFSVENHPDSRPSVENRPAGPRQQLLSGTVSPLPRVRSAHPLRRPARPRPPARPRRNPRSFPPRRSTPSATTITTHPPAARLPRRQSRSTNTTTSLAVSTRRLMLSRPPNITGRAVPLIFPACRAGSLVASAHGPRAKPLALASGPCHGPRVSEAARFRRGCAVPHARVSPVRFDL